MAASNSKRFCLSKDLDVSQISENGKSTKVCVIGIFGKSRFSPFTSKATCLNSVIDKEVFKGVEGYLQKKINQGELECFYDADSRVVYLHLVSFNDTNQLARECQRLAQAGDTDQFYSLWQSEDFNHAKNLAFLFAVSHILLLHHPGSSFDLSYLRLFYNLDNMRLKLQAHVTDLLSSVPGVSKDWASFGRICTPRMLFIFETPAVDVQPDDGDAYSNKAYKKLSSVKKLQLAIEDTIFRILRKTRAITNISNNSLFSVPLNQPYVYIQARKGEISDPINFLLSHIKAKCFPVKEESVASGQLGHQHQSPATSQHKPKPYSQARRYKPNPPNPDPLPLSASSLKSSTTRSTTNIHTSQSPHTPFSNSVPSSSSSSSSISLSTSSTQQNNNPPPSHSPRASNSFMSLPTTTSSSSSTNVNASNTGISLRPHQQEQGLKEFLWQHVDMVHAKTVNDNMGRHGIEPFFELPYLDTWLKASCSLYGLFFPTDVQDASITQPFLNLKHTLDISMKFSESRCQKWMSSAESTYQQDLPSFYITSYHDSRLAKAKRVFSQYARGPAFSKYLEELELWCEAYWKAGKQQCEAVSLSNNLCTLQRHLSPTDVVDSPEKREQVVKHCSGLKSKSACNCGRTQAERSDPFSHQYSNYDFYQALETNCCGELEHLDLPKFVPSTPDILPIAHSSMPPSPQVSSVDTDTPAKQTNKLHSQHDKGDAFSTMSNLSLALSLEHQSTVMTVDEPTRLSQSLHSPADSKSSSQVVVTSKALPKDSVVAGAGCGDKHTDLDFNTQQDKSMPLMHQISTTEYLSTMISTKSPPGLLPQFSSFSVCRLGSSSGYSHNLGLDMPGFLPGSSFLLPWDILVKHEPKDKWPSVAETFSGGSKKRQQRKLSKVSLDSGDTQTTVRIYLGMEYECPRGHRFCCSGPDKIIKVSSNSTVKDNAGRLVHMDMPLYTLCHCKQPKGCMAQMMRLFVVTPKDSPNCPSVRVQVNPILQPSPPPCPQFHAGLESALELPADGVWVIRLPHVYQDEEGVYLMPSDPQRLHSSYLIKGTFSHRVL